MSSQLIEQIKLQYKQSLPDKAEKLEKLWKASKNNPDELLGFLHQLAGSAGMYGYDQITDTAVNLRSKIKSARSINTNIIEYQKLYQLLIDNSK